MTALVISQSRQGTAQTHNVKVTCSHRQKKPTRKTTTYNTCIYHLHFLGYVYSISKQWSKYHYHSEITRTVITPRNEE